MADGVTSQRWVSLAAPDRFARADSWRPEAEPAWRSLAEGRWRYRLDPRAAPAADSAQAALLVQARLLAFGAEEAPVPQVAQDAGALDRGLEPL